MMYYNTLQPFTWRSTSAGAAAKCHLHRMRVTCTSAGGAANEAVGQSFGF